MRHAFFVVTAITMFFTVPGLGLALDPGQLTGTTGYGFSQPVEVAGLPDNVSALAAGLLALSGSDGRRPWILTSTADGQNSLNIFRPNLTPVVSLPVSGLASAGRIMQFAQGRLLGRLSTLAVSADKGLFVSMSSPLVFWRVVPTSPECISLGNHGTISALFAERSSLPAGFYTLSVDTFCHWTAKLVRSLPLNSASQLQVANGLAFFHGDVGGVEADWVIDAQGYHQRDPTGQHNEPRLIEFPGGSLFRDYDGSPALLDTPDGKEYETFTEIGPFDGVLPATATSFIVWKQVYNVLTPTPQWEEWVSWWQNGAYSKSQIYVASAVPQVGRRLSNLLPFGNLAFGNFEGKVYALPVVRATPLRLGYSAIF